MICQNRLHCFVVEVVLLELKSQINTTRFIWLLHTWLSFSSFRFGSIKLIFITFQKESKLRSEVQRMVLSNTIKELLQLLAANLNKFWAESIYMKYKHGCHDAGWELLMMAFSGRDGIKTPLLVALNWSWNHKKSLYLRTTTVSPLNLGRVVCKIS